MRTLRNNTRPENRRERRIGLARALSKQGICSRTAATALILEGRVRLDGVVVRDPEAPTRAHSRIEVDGAQVTRAPPLYLMLNKPRGLVTTATDEQARATVYQCFEHSQLPWVAPVGRLDQASEGLLLFTNDPAWAAALTSPLGKIAKTYHVQINGQPEPSALVQLMRGLTVPDGEFLQVELARLLRSGERNAWLEITLLEGRNRHLRRLLEALGHPVMRLVRVAVGGLTLGDLGKGKWRYLSSAEVSLLSPSNMTAVIPNANKPPSSQNKC